MSALPARSEQTRHRRTETAENLTTHTENVFSSPPAPNRYRDPNSSAYPMELAESRIDQGQLEPDPTNTSTPSSPSRKRDIPTPFFSFFYASYGASSHSGCSPSLFSLSFFLFLDAIEPFLAIFFFCYFFTLF